MLRGIEKGGCGELPPSGSAKGTVVSSGPTSRAIDAPSVVRVGAGLLLGPVGPAALLVWGLGARVGLVRRPIAPAAACGLSGFSGHLCL